MDNFTHTLIGAALAQGAILYRLSRQARNHRVQSIPFIANTQDIAVQETTNSAPTELSTSKAAGIAALPMIVTSVLANNFPDADLLVTAFMDPKLGYILHHRGHTHTLLFTLLQPLLLLGGLKLYQRWKATSWTKEDWRWFFGLAFLGGLVHLGMDGWNVYGVHPFWPFDNHWYYGDFVFIIEPLFWIALIPWLYSQMERSWTRKALLFFYILGFVALFVVYFTVFWYPLLLLFFGLSYGFLIRKQVTQARQAWLSLAAMMFVLGTLFGSSLWLKSMLYKALQRQDPHEKISDISLMSYPSNPLCYQWISVGYQTQSKEYVMRRGLFSFLPKQLRCPEWGSESTATLTPDPTSLLTQVGGQIGPQMVFRRPLQELRSLKGHCLLDAAMQFIRTPAWKISPHSFFVGDLRFDRRKAYDLAEFQFPKKPKICPVLRPPWIAPLTKGGLW